MSTPLILGTRAPVHAPFPVLSTLYIHCRQRLLNDDVDLPFAECFDSEAEGGAAAMTRQPTRPDVGADEGDKSVAVARPNNGQLNRSMILQTALAIIDRDGVD